MSRSRRSHGDARPGGHRGDARPGGGLPRSLVILLAVASGAVAANLYYAQPLLHTLGRDLSVSEATAGLLVTVTQVGYLLGLALLVELGDVRERRWLITGTLLITAAAMAACALAPGFTVLAAALAVVGVSSVMAQMIVPMSATLAADGERGRVVGTVMSGLLIGILLARTFSGIVASALGWRVVFWLGAAAMVVLAATLRRALPRVQPPAGLSYAGVLRSVMSLIASEPVLRQRMVIGALTFGCFSTLWTSLSFLLSGAPFHYGNAVIGLFGLVGVVGASAATVAGRLADRGRGGAATTATALAMLVAWAILLAGRHSVVWLIVGIALLDLGVQGLHISNQSAIYALAPEARSRLTTAYMVAYFIGGALLSAITAALYASDGWSGVCTVGGTTAAVALAFWALTARTGRPRPAGEACAAHAGAGD